jgi:membrane protease YdiL (CAAX protease family)
MSESLPAAAVAAPESPAAGLRPWSIGDTWLGVGSMAILIPAMLAGAIFLPSTQLIQTIAPIVDELMYLIPVAIILAWRRVSWKVLGFHDFSGSMLGLGCGLLAGAYFITLVHNMVLISFGITTQGAQIIQIFELLKSPVGLVVAGVLTAPVVEEIFFRGFLFPGFRQRYGWNNAALLSSGIFALAHLSPVAFIPTFALGYVLAFLYHRANSIWPGIIMHFLLNAFGICVALAAAQFPGLH